ncbi:MAG: hypothetical protein GAK35_03293 [Herbaspirillum frisingense]|uniref:Integrase catalytic domain-containing protein n=1 Tax=Herbaspirillum frisingense TaxID=92645 RepID=A0A7V8FUH3_9BURK|nr:MAG: hypothetical protein GAK35_03293 [Herbaspirillum frisingense]
MIYEIALLPVRSEHIDAFRRAFDEVAPLLMRAKSYAGHMLAQGIEREPDRVWVADITYIRIASGFIYLAVVLDACSRKVIGYALSKRIDTPLALAVLTAAYRIRKPAPGTCI